LGISCFTLPDIHTTWHRGNIVVDLVIAIVIFAVTDFWLADNTWRTSFIDFVVTIVVDSIAFFRFARCIGSIANNAGSIRVAHINAGPITGSNFTIIARLPFEREILIDQIVAVIIFSITQFGGGLRLSNNIEKSLF
jgi:hypothetical protein